MFDGEKPGVDFQRQEEAYWKERSVIRREDDVHRWTSECDQR